MLARVRAIGMAVPLEHLALGIWGVIFGQCGLSPREDKKYYFTKKRNPNKQILFSRERKILVEHQNDGDWVSLVTFFFCLKIFWGSHLEILQLYSPVTQCH